MQRNWTQVGHEHNGTQEQRDRLSDAFDALDWQPIPCTMSGMGGLGIQACINELRLRNVSHVAESHELAPYGLYGIRCGFANGSARVYVCDEGSQMVVLASDFYPRSDEPATEARACGDAQVCA